jgi:hypothetical protein
VQNWLKKASVQTAVVSGIFLLIVTIIVQFSPKAKLEKEVVDLKDEVQRLETQLAPFRALAIQRFGGSEEQALSKLAAQVQDLQTQLERATGTIRRFDVVALATFTGDWKSATLPNLSNLFRKASREADIRVELKSGGADMRWVEFTESGAPRMATGENGNWTLDYTAQAPAGSWVLGANRDDLQACGALEMILYGIDRNVTHNGVVVVKSVELSFFVNGTPAYRCEYKPNFRAELPEEQIVPVMVHLKGPVTIQKIP